MDRYFVEFYILYPIGLYDPESGKGEIIGWDKSEKKSIKIYADTESETMEKIKKIYNYPLVDIQFERIHQ